jgi:hypothetical protein
LSSPLVSFEDESLAFPKAFCREEASPMISTFSSRLAIAHLLPFLGFSIS